jgi:hypothetical protein
MTTLRMISLWAMILVVLASCEQEELQNTSITASNFNPKLTTKAGELDRKYEVVDLKSPTLDQDGYQRLKTSKITGSELYAKVEGRKVVSYQIRQRNRQVKSFTIANRGNQCPDIWACIHPQTGQYIFYDKCVTKDPCGRPVCSDLTWCIHPETGDYLLYDKCTTEDPCQKDEPPIIVVAKNANVQQFCPTTDYTWMIDPNTGEYLLLQECDYGQQLFVPIGW